MKTVIATLLWCFVFVLPTRSQTCGVLGPDITATVCPGDFVNLEDLFPNLMTYTSVAWFPTGTEPQAAPPGNYTLSVINNDGCTDQCNISIRAFERPSFFVNKTLQYCQGQNGVDITTAYGDLTGFLVDWGTANPQAATEGMYTVLISTQDNNVCSYEATIYVEQISSDNPSLTDVIVYNMANGNAPAFTTNNFRSLAVDNNTGYVWAGTTGNPNNQSNQGEGGLYFFDRQNWTQTKAGDKRTFRELLVQSSSIFEPKVWAASTGNNTATAVGGGGYLVHKVENSYFETPFKKIEQNYRCGGDWGATVILPEFRDSAGGLSSDFATALSGSTTHKIYMGLGVTSDPYDVTCLTIDGGSIPVSSFFTRNGGLYEYDLNAGRDRWKRVTNIDYRAGDGNVTAIGKKGSDIWVAFQRTCRDGGCGSSYIAKYAPSATSEGSPAGISIDGTNSPLPFNNPSNPIVRAIFTDSRNRTFVGFNMHEGIGVLDEGGFWHLITSSNSKLPAGASVNFNAIAEADDRIFIGTDAGLLEYTGTGSFTECTSYKLYTTASGLPSNNVMDVAYSQIDKQIWLATDAGVCSVGDRARTIRGYVQNISCGNPFQTPVDMIATPVPNIHAKLYTMNDLLIDDAITDAQGFFVLTQGEPGVNYKVKVFFDVVGDGSLVYVNEYVNVKYDDLMGQIPFPHDLLVQLRGLIPKMKEECVSLSVGFGTPPLEICLDQFDMSEAAFSYTAYTASNPIIIRDNHLKRIINLAAYYFLLQAVEQGSKVTAKLASETGTSIGDMAEALANALEMSVKWKMYGSGSTDNADGLAWLQSEAIILLREICLNAIRFYKLQLLNAGDMEGYKKWKEIEDFIKGYGELLAKIRIDGGIVKGALTTLSGTGVDIVKKLIGLIVAKSALSGNASSFQESLDIAAHSCNEANFNGGYTFLYNAIINNNGNAVLNKINTINDNYLFYIEGFRLAAKVGDLVQKIAKLTSIFSIVAAPGIAAGAKTVENFAKWSQPVLHTFSAVTGLIGVVKTRQEIARAFLESGLLRTFNTTGNTFTGGRVLSYNIDTALNFKKNAYNNELLQLRHTIQQNDTTHFYNRLDTLRIKDSIFRTSLVENHDNLEPYLGNTMQTIPQLDSLYQYYIENLYIKRFQYQFALNEQLFAYAIDSFRVSDVPDLLGTIDTLLQLNDSVFIGLSDFSTIISIENVSAPAFVSVRKIDYNYIREPQKVGTVTITYKNIGKETANNVRFKFLPDSLMHLNSPDSILEGNIAPGESRNVTWSITTPAVDTTVNFKITTAADNGLANDAYGFISAFKKNGKAFTLRDGNWSNPDTWSTGEVPQDITEVNILHRVFVDIDAVCKSLYSEIPGNLIINTGRNLTILK